MKLVLASYFQEENHGPGRKIGISPGKPKDIDYECDLVFHPLSPGQLYWDYHNNKRNGIDEAGEIFEENYRQQLKEFVENVKKEAEKQNKSIFDLLPFSNDGDTLLSWENKGNKTYRSITAEYLRELGYDVIEN